MMKETKVRVRVLMNPAAGFLKPVEEISDRAKRYRANREGFRPADPKVCAYCGSDRNVGVGHKDGNESNGKPGNLEWTCKSCNARLAVWMKKRGLGERVNQLNPAKKKRKPKTISKSDEKRMVGEYTHLLRVMRGEPHGGRASAEAFDKIMSFPAWFRSDYSRKAYGYRGGR